MNWLISLRNEKTPALEKKILRNGNYRQNLASVSVNFNIVFCVKRISIVLFVDGSWMTLLISILVQPQWNITFWWNRRIWLFVRDRSDSIISMVRSWPGVASLAVAVVSAHALVRHHRRVYSHHSVVHRNSRVIHSSHSGVHLSRSRITREAMLLWRHRHSHRHGDRGILCWLL